MADKDGEEVWSVQHRLLLSNALEVLPSQNWPAISRLVRQFSLAVPLTGEPVSYTANECISQQEILLSDYEDIVKKILGPNQTVSDAKLEPATYVPISSSLRKLRLKELRSSVERNNKDIRAIRKEIEAVRSGKRDATFKKIRAAALGVELEEASKIDMDTAKTNPQVKEKLLALVQKLSSQTKYAKPFLHPVSAEEVPTYATIIKNPIDFSTITTQIEEGTLASRYEVMFAVLLMCRNAASFNPPGTELHSMAMKLREIAVEEADAIFGPVQHYGQEKTTRSRPRA